ncbi:aldehyde ferredoxin oxidoreductase family protein [Desulfoscipio geothermicus]|uniref:Aldehyde:ferredoxin oxidoreductase n=1 Tax=Desulfoscipio geothermicus DSM 3669 TaxID=1121426 RepID=A0A1I6DIF1_9FIRM|nr:aldehyde ferredoxin oxidoreductase family protein [Desulfoscipio geothermicus]SFR05223.1 aldehyde:ferredoxin oxidoreductase [Desulfoscipio geothermicus DSM 3669]
MKGYIGKVLRIDLNNLTSSVESLNLLWAEKYIGGKGLAMKYIYEELPPKVDPLSPKNKMILMTGPLTGTAVPCSGKLTIAAKSPATNTILDCSIGGHIAGEIKYAGYDAIIIEGKAEKPVYLHIENSKVELKSAGNLWGKGTHETEFFLKATCGPEVKVLAIGPAGENMVPMACITSELYRQAGRGGIGAVMGSKNLKAIVVKGTNGVKVADPKQLTARAKEIMKKDTLSDDNLWAYTDGTPIIVELSNSTGVLPTRNFQQGTFDGFDKIHAEAVKAVRKDKKGCLSCGLGCGNYVNTGQSVVEGPEYETLSIGGSNCGIDDLEAIVEFNKLCDDLGLDTISTGNTIAFAMELTEKGIKDFNLKFGDVKGYLKATKNIANKETELALGVKGLSEKYGGKEFAMQVKGLEFPGYEPRGSWGMGLAYATSDRGACHTRAWPIADEAYGDMDPFTIEGKAELVVGLQHYNAAKFSTILCDFWALSLETVAELLTLVTGKQYTEKDLKIIGERIVNLARMFNIREGFDAKDDRLPQRIYKEALKTGATAEKLLPEEEFNKMLREYYQIRGWDSEGKPTGEKLDELAI